MYLTLSAALALLAPPAEAPKAAPHSAAPAEVPGGVHVFGLILYDLEKNRWRFGTARIGHGIGIIQNCSDARFFCLLGGAAIALPRKCSELARLDTWEAGGVRMRVAARHRPLVERHDFPYPVAEEILLLYREGSRWAVFEYLLGFGVTAIYLDPTHREDIASFAETQDLDALGRRKDRHELLTLDAFGGCDKRETEVPPAAARPG
jgi:hypothetical protein